ncbi:DUF4350 domain-containing protein [Bogoriella caseilytica]|uniref:Uncharacterized protein DUF4350 n=1 Tax=Bogoriella caseilytica TaxID=56055 RepID=A0A3N2BEQ6_9MICO|nr:DUF4350 domain-containing protein [Bogoriella caseilytica]ROR73738.1 uncharacterized protein DUF4350 [Bogoriella caseilytica]
MTAPPIPAQAADSAAPAAPVSRRRRRLMLTLFIVVVVTLFALTALLEPRTSTRPLAPDNPGGNGAMATARILEEQGVDVREVRAWSELQRQAESGSTVFVPHARMLRSGQVEQLLGTGADVVLAGQLRVGDPLMEELPLSTSRVSTQTASASCPERHAAAAGEIEVSQVVVPDGAPDELELCFPAGDGGAWATWPQDGGTVTYLASPEVVSNGMLAEYGHAALTFRTLGAHETLLWYLPPDLEAAGAVDDSVPMVPPALWTIGAVLAAAVALLGLAQGRGMGPVVVEVMPVTVPSAETTFGRGRLYRRSGARDHSAAALRAGSISRMATSLGLPRSAGRDSIIDAVVRASGHPREDVAGTLYGPPPPDDGSLLHLSTTLDALEKEVRRP